MTTTYQPIFPAALQQAALALLGALPSASAVQQGFTVSVQGEQLSAPCRIYCTPSGLRYVIAHSSGEVLLLALSLGTRHSDGRIREQCLRQIVAVDRPWVAPFVVQLLGEYVIEIVEVIAAAVYERGPEPFAGFAQENPQFMATTRRRATSYWHCYYRGRFPALQAYPAITALDAIERMARGV
jgi:hypothetical protein